MLALKHREERIRRRYIKHLAKIREGEEKNINNSGKLKQEKKNDSEDGKSDGFLCQTCETKKKLF